MKQWLIGGLLLVLLCLVNYARPCSMFKITLYGKTMVGNNEDAWRVNSRIWFETGKNGACGAAYVGHDDGFPQGGMNTAGLVYDGFAVYPRKLRPVTGKEKVTDWSAFLKRVLQQCATVREVQALVNQYDRSTFNRGMLLFIDKTGEYLVVEVDTTLLGHDKKYVLSNFCPSQTPNPEKDVKIPRYHRGLAFLRDREDTSLAFCVSMMDTMHECRPHLGDGTTYTSIYDLEAGLIYLYFYHDYRHCVTFNLQTELSKGDHMLLMTSLFPPNAEYIRFTRYKTPWTSTWLHHTLVLLMFFFLFTLPCYLLILVRRPRVLWPALAVINLGLAYFIPNLIDSKAAYYFKAPYSEPGRALFNVSFYFPLVLLGLIIPVSVLAFRTLRAARRNKVYLSFAVVNFLAYIVLMSLFGYWDLYHIW